MLYRSLVNTVFINCEARRHAALNRVLFGRDGTGQQMAGNVFFYLSRQQLAARLPFGHLDAGGIKTQSPMRYRTSGKARDSIPSLHARKRSVVNSYLRRHAALNRVLFGRDGAGQQMAGHCLFTCLGSRPPFGHPMVGRIQRAMMDVIQDLRQSQGFVP